MRSLSSLSGIGTARLKTLNDAGIVTLRDLLFTLPSGYKDTLTITPIGELTVGQSACVEGALKNAPTLSRFKGKCLVSATLSDGSGTLPIKYYNQSWMKETLSKMETLTLYGRVGEYQGRKVMFSPSIERERGLLSAYRAIGNVSGAVLKSLIKQALEEIEDCVKETLPECVRRDYHLCEINFALRQAHFPDSHEALNIAKRRLAFESLLTYQAAMGLLRGAKAQGVQMDAPNADAFFAALPFAPTGAQMRVLTEIQQDLRAPAAMSRLVQGDVGCGKTAVAFGAIWMAAQCGYQSALMAPTEILARQHFLSAQALLKPLGVTCGLLLGGMKAAQKREALENIQSGAWQLVIGTHALLSEGVNYQNLGLVITDEQHRFGVKQRRALSKKAELEPNALIMSATPIPRSLALVLYGDLDLSVVDEMPPGRTPVHTRIVPEEKRAGLYRFIIEEVKKGRQAYIVCPLVEESEVLNAASAQEEYATLSTGALRDVRVGLTYGGQEPAQKERVITAFTSGDIDVLIATTVIEVGVNVSTASIMVIENADRFGLSQLHQLRGRVGRGATESWCFFMAQKNERLGALLQSNDGFFIANEDLRLRGPGDFLGTRQHGDIFMGAQADVRLIEQTRDCLKALRQPGGEQALRQVLNSAREAYQTLLENIALT